LEFLLPNKSSGVFNQVQQHLERLGPQLEIPVSGPQATTSQIERKAVETQDPMDNHIHSAPPQVLAG
jgi:hypothetical protein